MTDEARMANISNGFFVTGLGVGFGQPSDPEHPLVPLIRLEGQYRESEKDEVIVVVLPVEAVSELVYELSTVYAYLAPGEKGAIVRRVHAGTQNPAKRLAEGWGSYPDD